MSEHIIKTPETDPDHHVVGHYYAGYSASKGCTQIYYCDMYDYRVDYFLQNIHDPTERKDVSVRAIGRTFHEAFERDHHWFVPSWGERILKSLFE